jgi:hypothetical protein
MSMPASCGGVGSDSVQAQGSGSPSRIPTRDDYRIIVPESASYPIRINQIRA